MAGEVQAMDNVQPPGHGRKNIINALLMNKMMGGRGGGGYSGGGGSSKKEWQNKSEYMKHQYALQDASEQSRTARNVEEAAALRRGLSADSAAMLNAGSAGRGGAAQQFNPNVHDIQEVPGYDMPAELNVADKFGTRFNVKAAARGYEPTPTEDGPTEDGPTEDGPVEGGPTEGGDQPPMQAPARKLKSEDIRLRLNNLVNDTGYEQGDKSDEEWDDYLGAASALANSHDIQARDETRSRNSNAKRKSKKDNNGMEGDAGPAPYKPETIRGGKASLNSSSADRANTEEGLLQTEYVTGITANKNGAPVLGTMGNRMAPSGEDGGQGSSTQFNTAGA